MNPPVLVTQIQMSPGEWLYIASLLPEPYTSLEEEGLPSQQVWFILLTSGFLLLFIGLLVHWQSRPLKRLARSARDMSLGAEEVRPVLEGGGSEVMEVGRALNTMRERISRYLTERSQLFSAISHDLRTPITRLRLRVELLEDEQLQLKFGRDLDELEMLVKGALQCVKDTDIHENIEPVDLNQALDTLVECYLSPNGNGLVSIDGRAQASYPGKPLALRRCMGNLIDNALKYGERAHLHIEDDDSAFVLHVDDEGPGVPEQRPSSACNRFSSRIFACPATSRAMAWVWASPATSPIAMAGKSVCRTCVEVACGLLCACREMSTDRQRGLFRADAQWRPLVVRQAGLADGGLDTMLAHACVVLAEMLLQGLHGLLVGFFAKCQLLLALIQG